MVLLKAFLNRCDPEESFCASRESFLGPEVSMLLLWGLSYPGYFTVQWNSEHQLIHQLHLEAQMKRRQSQNAILFLPTASLGAGLQVLSIISHWLGVHQVSKAGWRWQWGHLPSSGFPSQLVWVLGIASGPCTGLTSHCSSFPLPPAFKLYWMSLCIPGWPWISL